MSMVTATTKQTNDSIFIDSHFILALAGLTIEDAAPLGVFLKLTLINLERAKSVSRTAILFKVNYQT